MARVLPALLAALLALPPATRADEAAPPKAPAAFYEVEVVKNQPYRDDPAADPVKHRLDLYVPKGVKDFPVMVFVHGGAWVSGRKELYGMLGALFARNGVGTAVINYRLSGGEKGVKHPEHVRDVARAFAWVHAHIARYGGRPDRIFLSGHSAGGHLVALLSTDPSYLKAEKLGLEDVRGVMPLSGVYTILPFVPVFHAAFGKDEEVCKNASPVSHVKGKHPPFLIAYADEDFPTCDRMSADLCTRLKECKCAAEVLKVPSRNHFTIILKLCLSEKDPCTQAMFDFIGRHSGWKPVAGR